MKDYRILKFLDKISWIFEKSGINYKQMRMILQLKLVMDGRRTATVMMRNKNDMEPQNNFRSTLLVYGFMGLFNIIFVFTPMPLFLKMNFIFGVLIFMVLTTMISDFSSVLLDIRDKNILLPRPVDPRSLNMAKLIHIVIYLSSIAAVIAGPALIFGSVKYGPVFFLLFLFELILICSFIIFFTSILYFAILTVFDGEKLKDMINYVQIVLTIFIAVFYQFVGRIFDSVNLKGATPSLWSGFLPSSWFSAPFSVFVEHNRDRFYLTVSLVGVVIPILAVVIYIKYIVPRFEKSLQKLNENSENKKGASFFKRKLIDLEAALVCADKNEKTFFRFTLNMLSKERKLKLRIYPNAALGIVMPFIMIIGFVTSGKSMKGFFSLIQGGKYYLFLYFTSFMLASLVSMLYFSEKYQGAWVYRVLPIQDPSVILKGALKAFVIKYIFPVFFIASVIFTCIYGLKIVPDLILIFINTIFLAIYFSKVTSKGLPFYKDFKVTQDGNMIGWMLLSMLISGGFAGLHILMLKIAFGVVLNIVISLVLTAILWRICMKTTWNDISYAK
ncbi:MAG: ABC transporter permease [Bacillota bacterium]|nr:ABC transporter permease [Bacillota bacterium]